MAYPPPERLPAGARQKAAQALLRNDLVIGVHRLACDAIAKWTTDGEEVLPKIADEGLRPIRDEPEDEDDRPASISSARAAYPWVVLGASAG